MDKNVQAVIDRHTRRAEVGLVKYSVTTERTDLNLAEWLQHLQDELMDAAVYVEWANRQVYTGLTEMYYLQGQEESKDATTKV